MASFLDSLYGVVFFQNMTNDSEKHLSQSLEQTDLWMQSSSTAVHSSNNAVKTFGEHRRSNHETLYINKWEGEIRQDTRKGAIISSVFVIFITRLPQAKNTLPGRFAISCIISHVLPNTDIKQRLQVYQYIFERKHLCV